MIDVEIQGSVAKKEYEKLKKTLETTGGLQRDVQVVLSYEDKGYASREARLEKINGAVRIVLQSGRLEDRKEIIVPVASGGFEKALDMLAELGYKKGTVSAEEVLSASFGGAHFFLFTPRDESYHYTAVIKANNPTEVKEAKQKLMKLARTFKLPVWSPLDMLAFFRKLKDATSYPYDYAADSSQNFLDTVQF